MRGMATATRRLTVSRKQIIACRLCRSFSSSSPGRGGDDDGNDEAAPEYQLHPSSTLIDVSPLADEIRSKYRTYSQNIGFNCVRPLKLTGILGPTGAYAELYSDKIAEMCAEDGVLYEVLRSSGDEPSDVEMAINRCKRMDGVTGVLVFYPLFPQRLLVDEPSSAVRNRIRGVYYKSFDDHLRSAVCPSQDVEGLCGEYNSRHLFRSQRMRPFPHHASSVDFIFPCTALSVKHILDHYHLGISVIASDDNTLREGPYDHLNTSAASLQNQWEGQIVTIVNRSEIMGRPLAAMLASCGARVFSIDIDSILEFRQGGTLRQHSANTHRQLEWCLRQSSVVVSGVPDPDFRLPMTGIVPGTTIVNVSEHENVCGDTLLSCPSIKFVPHVGKVTVAVLMQNLVRLHQRSLRLHV